MRQIDADSLYELLQTEYEFHKKLFDEYGDRERGGIVRGFAMASEMICKQPIVDVAPVIHAKWISKYEGNPGECSHCHEFWDGEFDGGECTGHWLIFPNFCPWCGAKMDAE